ncbi:DgyrCDS3736 [Dimorphilus gyrociliatus]|uniref:DgyrCDS3736 n=1 Tax=Dimorphilus gyrociliatus TaxID=2664684 RepID=A0A7I8VFD9_9ANNE|nr:DgyrCDS3736 [Dimorphilus gyrociliatus]
MTVEEYSSQYDDTEDFERRSDKVEDFMNLEEKSTEICEKGNIVEEIEIKKNDNKFEEGGYGWLICIGAFIIYFIIGGVMRCYSLFYDSLLEKFEHSNAKTAWVGAIHSSTKLLLGPVAGALQGYLSPRQMIFIGATCWSLGLVLTGISNSLELCIVSFGILSALGANFLLVTTLFIIPQYFNKKKGKVMGLVFCGVSTGMIAFAYIFPLLFDQYGFFGTFLILSGVSLHIFISAMLYRLPTNTQLKKDTLIKDKNDDSFDKKKALSERFINELKSKLRLFQNRSFCFSCFVFSSLFVAFNTINTFTSGLLRERDFKSNDVSLLFLVSGLLDVLSRPIFGIIIDIKPLRERRYLVYTAISCFGGIGILCMALFAHSRILLLCLIPISTSVIGSCASQLNTIVSDIVELDRLGDAIGFVRFTQGVGVLFAPTIGGLLKDITDTYTYNFILSAVLLIIPTILFAFYMHLIDSRKKKKEREGVTVFTVA